MRDTKSKSSRVNTSEDPQGVKKIPILTKDEIKKKKKTIPISHRNENPIESDSYCKQ